jgi:hypothetical protein
MFIIHVITKRNWRSLVIRVTRLQAGQIVNHVLIHSKLRNFSLLQASRMSLVPTQPPIQWIVVDILPEVKRPEREANHSLPSNAEVKKEWSCVYTPKIWLHDLQGDNFRVVHRRMVF